MNRRPTNIKGERVGTYVAVVSTGKKEEHSGSYIWELRCTSPGCNRTVFMTVARLCRYQRDGRFPRCNCDEYRALPRVHRPSTRVPRCVGCSGQHRLRDCPERKRARIRCDCARQRWRVPPGKTCSCGLTYEPEAKVEIELDSRSSSAGLALAFASGGEF